MLHVYATRRSYAHPGMSWRVGVSAVIDPVAVMALGPLGQSMLDKDTIPAVMTVTPYMDKPARDGAKVVLAKEMLYKVELLHFTQICSELRLVQTCYLCP